MPLGENPLKIFVGRQFHSVGNDQTPLTAVALETLIARVNNAFADYVVLPIDARDSSARLPLQRGSSLTNGQQCQEAQTTGWPFNEVFAGAQYKLLPSCESDLVAPTDTWSWSIVLSMSSWIPQGFDRTNRHFSPAFHTYCQTAFSQQLSWAAHCCAYALILPPPSAAVGACAVYAQQLSGLLSPYLQTRLWLRVPLTIGSPQGADSPEDGWTVWNRFRTLTDSNLLAVALELTEEIPEDQEVLRRWLAEPVHAVIIPSRICLSSDSPPFIAFPKPYKEFLLKLLRYKVQVIIESPENAKHLVLSTSSSQSLLGLRPVQPVQNGKSEVSVERRLPAAFSTVLNLVAHLREALPAFTPEEEFVFPCFDQLQAPLQPLRDNLESRTYETFERDPVKYVCYEKAILEALKDRIAGGKTRHVLYVVGAGRGPIVAAALQALRTANIASENYKVVALEKNENALITLRYRIQKDPNTDWRSVTVVGSDMRFYVPEEPADLLISELLGSFGDNELSPECLDGAQRFLAPDGISIPASYYSSIEPIMTSKLWNSCKASPKEVAPQPLETPHVVMIHTAYPLSIEGPQECFQFEHPSPTPILPNNSHNERYIELTFTAKADAICHGLAGYFHCTLYKDVTLSIHPPTKTERMISWFPLYFPIAVPFFVQKKQSIKFHIWRHSRQSQVWYEWAFSEPVPGKLHNVNGRAYTIML